MFSAVIFINGEKEYELASLVLNDKMLVDYTIDTLRRLDLDSIYLIGGDKLDIENVIKRTEIDEITSEIGDKDGKCLLLSPFYPLVEKDDYLNLMASDNCVFYDEELVPIFCLNNSDINRFESINYNTVPLNKENNKRFNSLKDVPLFWKEIKHRIINKLLDNGVVILDPKNTSIGIDANIDKGTYIASNVSIGGKTTVGKNNRLLSGTKIYDSKIGDNNVIEDSKINQSTVGSGCMIGPNSVIEHNCFIGDNTKISSYSSLSNCRLGNECFINHMSCLSNASIRNNVKVGANVTTANNKLVVLGSCCEIGNGVNLISPLYIGSYAFVAAGSTIDKNVENGDMAIARLYQQNKKGYGYRYTKEGQ